MSRSFLACVAILLAAVLVGACSSRPVVPPDPRLRDPTAREFLVRVDRTCANYGIGGETVGYEMDVNNDDARFLNLTTALFFAEITRQDYAEKIDVFYPGGSNRMAIQCILAELR